MTTTWSEASQSMRLVNVTDDDLDVALDAFLSGSQKHLHQLGVASAQGLVMLAERMHRRGDPDTARRVFRKARKLDPRVPLRGAACVLASRTAGTIRREVADLMQWNPSMLRVTIMNTSYRAFTIRRMNLEPSHRWYGWWTEAECIAQARREAWDRVMTDEVEDAWRTNARIDRVAVAATAQQIVEDALAGRGIGELFGQPGQHRVTASGFTVVEGW